jgi:hypothetical protein
VAIIANQSEKCHTKQAEQRINLLRQIPSKPLNLTPITPPNPYQKNRHKLHKKQINHP